MRTLRLLMLVLPALPGCYRVMAVFNDTAAPGPDETSDAKPVVRSYETPDVAMTAAERTDIEHMCSAIVAEDARNTAPGKDRGAYGRIQPKSKWGTEMLRHLNQEGRHVAAPRVARLLQQEGMKWASPDCRSIVKRYSRYH
ncbi:MAG: hypothetical protein VX265_03015 [Myxococcota bacterium]|nr:hypothetical protein [Myxococcota bacterium]MEC8423424.1 hypothetical protein [Myxococcota bacterium]